MDFEFYPHGIYFHLLAVSLDIASHRLSLNTASRLFLDTRLFSYLSSPQVLGSSGAALLLDPSLGKPSWERGAKGGHCPRGQAGRYRGSGRSWDSFLSLLLCRAQSEDDLQQVRSCGPGFFSRGNANCLGCTQTVEVRLQPLVRARQILNPIPSGLNPHPLRHHQSAPHVLDGETWTYANPEGEPLRPLSPSTTYPLSITHSLHSKHSIPHSPPCTWWSLSPSHTHPCVANVSRASVP